MNDDNSIERLFTELKAYENQGRVALHIDSDGFLTYFYDSPQVQVKLADADRIVYRPSTTAYIYSIPRHGDLLLNINIDGPFNHIALYQYDWTGSQQCIYSEVHSIAEKEENRPVTMAPFPYSGIPLLQCGKAVYVSIDSSNHDAINIIATYALLDRESRIKLAQYVDHVDDYNGVKCKHTDGTTYQVYGVRDSGFSPNYLGPIK